MAVKVCQWRCVYGLQAAGGVRLLLIDNMAAFHALDRTTQALPQHIEDDAEADAQLGLQQAHGCLVAELQALAQQHRLAVLATRHSGAPASAGFDRCTCMAYLVPCSAAGSALPHAKYHGSQQIFGMWPSLCIRPECCTLVCTLEALSSV